MSYDLLKMDSGWRSIPLLNHLSSIQYTLVYWIFSFLSIFIHIFPIFALSFANAKAQDKTYWQNR